MDQRVLARGSLGQHARLRDPCAGQHDRRDEGQRCRDGGNGSGPANDRQDREGGHRGHQADEAGEGPGHDDRGDDQQASRHPGRYPAWTASRDDDHQGDDVVARGEVRISERERAARDVRSHQAEGDEDRRPPDAGPGPRPQNRREAERRPADIGDGRTPEEEEEILHDRERALDRGRARARRDEPRHGQHPDGPQIGDVHADPGDRERDRQIDRRGVSRPGRRQHRHEADAERHHRDRDVARKPGAPRSLLQPARRPRRFRDRRDRA